MLGHNIDVAAGVAVSVVVIVELYGSTKYLCVCALKSNRSITSNNDSLIAAIGGLLRSTQVKWFFAIRPSIQSVYLSTRFTISILTLSTTFVVAAQTV